MRDKITRRRGKYVRVFSPTTGGDSYSFDERAVPFRALHPVRQVSNCFPIQRTTVGARVAVQETFHSHFVVVEHGEV